MSVFRFGWTYFGSLCTVLEICFSGDVKFMTYAHPVSDHILFFMFTLSQCFSASSCPDAVTSLPLTLFSAEGPSESSVVAPPWSKPCVCHCHVTLDGLRSHGVPWLPALPQLAVSQLP